MTLDIPGSGATPVLWKPKRQFNQRIELVVKIIFATFALVSVATTLGIVLTLIFETFEFFKEIPLWKFLSDARWTPLIGSEQFGIFVVVSATLLTSTIAITVAVPLGLLSAICLSEYATAKARSILKPLLEILAGVPSIVFGYFALLFVSPIVQWVYAKLVVVLEPMIQFVAADFEFPTMGIFNALSAGLVLGVSITPLVASLSEDAIYAVPNSLRDGSYALGATKRETITAVVLPAALSGIVSSIILAISRAVGETMIVTLAGGQEAQTIDWSLNFINPINSLQTMTAFIVQVSLGDAPAGTTAYKTLFAVGMTLFLITLTLNIFSFWFVRRFQEKYE